MSGVEVVGIVAAVGQFVEQTVKVVQLVQAVRRKSRGAPAEIQQWIQEIETLKDIATEVQRTAALQTPQIERILRRCDGHSRSLCPFSTPSPTKRTPITARRRGRPLTVFRKRAALGRSSAIWREKSSLITHITTANLL
ncbi:hypothetical protein B0T25DRAFT_597681 [Lasiosphaeria hispida]|uniref:Uncharacterized protein n=1 Tax=Lasiosphaeria hispida TaxID=260671 RepID=A0AAJ0HWI9_9PEZI|nr:hypothetical protein B0T25DRAFT_597681 [Lasiosphaeria hispida]